MDVDEADRRQSLSAVLITDVVGSTAHRLALGEAAANRHMVRLEQVQRQLVEDANGLVIRGVGDGIVAALPSVSGAIQVALDIERHVDESDAIAGVPPLRIRAVIDVGDIDWNEAGERGTVLDRANTLIASWDGSGIVCTPLAVELASHRDGFEMVAGVLPGTFSPRRSSVPPGDRSGPGAGW